jgi:hypothetical protein
MQISGTWSGGVVDGSGYIMEDVSIVSGIYYKNIRDYYNKNVRNTVWYGRSVE